MAGQIILVVDHPPWIWTATDLPWRPPGLPRKEAILPDERNIFCIQATGGELQFILNNMEGIPKSQKLIQFWYGDDAKKIWADLLS